MFGTGKSGSSIYEELSYKALSIASVREIGDSSIKRISHRVYNTNESSSISSISYFNNKVGKMSDGMHVTIPQSDPKSYNILTSIVLSTKSHGEISSSHNRFGNNLDGVFIYINGLKVPDSSVHMYMTNSNTNFIIAKKYFNDGNNDILIEKRQFKNFTYGGTANEAFVGDSILFSVSNHRNLSVSESTTLVFINGRYISPHKPYGLINSISYTNNTVIVKFSKVVSGNIEVFIDSSAKYSKTSKLTGNSSVVPYYIHDDFINPIYGPINRDNCSFFVNGERINNNEIQQKGRLNFILNKSITSDDTFTIIFTDNGEIDIRSFTLYGDDYFLYNFIGSSGVTNKLLGPKNGPITTLPVDKSVINYEEALKSLDYSYGEVLNILNDIESISDTNLKIQLLLKKCPYLLKEFLEYFASSSIVKNINYSGTGNVTVGVNSDHDVGTSVIRVISVNGFVAKVDRFTITSTSFIWESENSTEDLPFWNSVVEGKWFKTGDNVVEIVESSSNIDNKIYKIAKIDRYDTVFNTHDYRAVLDVFGDIRNIDDFEMLAITKKRFDPDGIYIDGEEYGFKTIKLPKMIINNKIYISFGPNDPKIDMFIIMVTRHHDYKTINIDLEDASYNSLFNILYCGTELFYDDNVYHSVKIPILHYGAMIAYDLSTGTRLFRGIDFSYKNPDSNPLLRNSGIVFKRKFDIETSIGLVITPEYTHSDKYVSMSTADTGPNKYALLYLNSLKFPFSTKYVKLFANNKNILDEDIDILSNKLIRLYNIETVCSNHIIGEDGTCHNCLLGGSLQNVYAEFSFKVSFNQLDPFITNYDDNGIEVQNDSEFEKAISKLFLPFHLSKPSELIDGIIDIGNINVANTIYNSFYYKVDSNNKTPNTIISGSFITNRYNIYADAYLRWFISDKSHHIWESFKDIPEYVLKEIEIFKTDYNSDNRDVVVRPENINLMSDIEISTNPDRYPGFNVEETKRIFLECCDENSLPAQICYDRYDEFTQSTVVFKRDLLPISALDTFDGSDIIVGRGETFKPE